MEIYVVQPGDTIQLIAEKFGLTVEKLIQDNGLDPSEYLVIGQSIVIAYPQQVYTVKEGDTLSGIANSFNVSTIQLLASNPYLSDREYLYPGDTIIISYNKKGKIITHGNTVPYIHRDILKKTLPHLTYLSVLNFTASTEGEIISYYDDTEIIQLAKAYGVAPLMLLTTLTITGETNFRVAFDILLNEEYQNSHIENILNILKTKGYYGLNFSLEYISISNLKFYESFFAKVANRLNGEGYPVFLTVNPQPPMDNNNVNYEEIDYSILNQWAQNIIFMSYEWAARITPPSPVSSINSIERFLNYALRYIPADKITIGIATIGYDWELPFVLGTSNVGSMALEQAYNLARDTGATIKYDEASQTPYFFYTLNGNIQHLVWFINSKSINATLELVSKYNLAGISVWNITIFNPELWLIIDSQYEVNKVI
ncbi:MAG TPA: LysM peptidoglycan-binding domain-containing protein [Clostridiales bacterium]|nr:LysM peptidoglycan-binding domain-containing protein [Clostridiales bacterium]